MKTSDSNSLLHHSGDEKSLLSCLKKFFLKKNKNAGCSNFCSYIAVRNQSSGVRCFQDIYLRCSIILDAPLLV